MLFSQVGSPPDTLLFPWLPHLSPLHGSSVWTPVVMVIFPQQFRCSQNSPQRLVGQSWSYTLWTCPFPAACPTALGFKPPIFCRTCSFNAGFHDILSCPFYQFSHLCSRTTNPYLFTFPDQDPPKSIEQFWSFSSGNFHCTLLRTLTHTLSSVINVSWVSPLMPVWSAGDKETLYLLMLYSCKAYHYLIEWMGKPEKGRDSFPW